MPGSTEFDPPESAVSTTVVFYTAWAIDPSSSIGTRDASPSAVVSTTARVAPAIALPSLPSRVRDP